MSDFNDKERDALTAFTKSAAFAVFEKWCQKQIDNCSNISNMQAIIDPDWPEFLKPGDMPARVREFCARTGQPVPQDTSEIMRCVLDSIALKYRWVVEHLEEVVGRRLEVVHIVGGGRRNELLSQLTADCLGRPVVTGPVEATAIGNLMVQAVARGDVADIAQARQIIRNSFDVQQYEPRDTAAWDEAYGRFLALIQE